MKSIQILLLFCVYLGETFPATMNKQDINVNLKALESKGYISSDPSDMVSGFDVTENGKAVIFSCYKEL